MSHKCTDCEAMYHETNEDSTQCPDCYHESHVKCVECSLMRTLYVVFLRPDNTYICHWCCT